MRPSLRLEEVGFESPLRGGSNPTSYNLTPPVVASPFSLKSERGTFEKPVLEQLLENLF